MGFHQLLTYFIFVFLINSCAAADVAFKQKYDFFLFVERAFRLKRGQIKRGFNIKTFICLHIYKNTNDELWETFQILPQTLSGPFLTCSLCVSGGVHDGPAVHAAVVVGVGVTGIQAGFGRHQRSGHRAAVASVHRLQLVVLRLGHEVVDGERVVEGVVVGVGVVVVRFQVRGLVQQQRVVMVVLVMVGEQVLGVRERGGHAHGAGGQRFTPVRFEIHPGCSYM